MFENSGPVGCFLSAAFLHFLEVRFLLNDDTDLFGLFVAAGERLSQYIALCCVVMALAILWQ